MESTSRLERVSYKRCPEAGCFKQATHGLLDGIPLTCRLHKLSNYRDVINMWCAAPGCTRKSRYGLLATGKKTHCSIHRFNHHVNLTTNKYCEHYIRVDKTVRRCPNVASSRVSDKRTCLRHRWSTDALEIKQEDPPGNKEEAPSTPISPPIRIHKFVVSHGVGGQEKSRVMKFVLLSRIAEQERHPPDPHPSGPQESITSHEQDFVEMHAYLDVSQEEMWNYAR